MKKIFYILLLMLASPVIPVISEINYPIIYFTALAMFATYLIIREERAKSTVNLTSTIQITIYVSLISIITAWLSQPPVTLNGGLGWDGINYASIYERFISGSSQLYLMPPFHQRIALPYLASRIPLEPRPAFFILHSCFWLGTMAFFVLVCRKGFKLSHSLAMLGVIWLQIHWISIPRATASYTYTVDSSAIFFMAALAYFFVIRQKGILIVLIAFVGSFFKETILLWCICLAFGALFINQRETCQKKQLIATILAAIIASIVANLYCKSVFPIQSDIGPLATILTWMEIRALDPIQYIRYVSSIFNVAGSFLAIFLVFFIEHIRDKEEKRSYKPELMAVACYLFICFFAGSDLTKFVFMSLPLTLPITLDLVEQYVDRAKYWYIWLMVMLALPTAHVFELIPSPFRGRELPNLDANGPYSWMMEYAHPFLVTFWLIWFCVIFIIAKITYRTVKYSNVTSSNSVL